MKARMAGAGALVWMTLARVAAAVPKPAPGTDATLHGKEAGGYGMTIGVVVAIVVAIAAGVWWYLANAQKGSGGK